MGVAAVITVVSMVSVAGQSQTGSTLKTAWGHPSLEGIWDVLPLQIPLQRPAKYKDQTEFTDAQRAELDKIRAAMPGNETRAVRGTEQDIAGAYNVVYTSRKPTGKRTSLIIDPPDGRIPPVTKEVTERRAEIRAHNQALVESWDGCKTNMPGCDGAKYTGKVNPKRFEQPKYLTHGRLNRMDGVEDHGIGTRCMGGNTFDFGGFRQIIQSPDAISIFHDTGQGQGWQRVIPLSAAAHLPANVRTHWGDARGRWEGNTLVVDTTNFNGYQDFQGSTDNLHMIEKWTRTGPDTIEYVATFDDPKSWTKPWTVKMEFAKQDDKFNRVYKEPRCMEGNYGMLAMLAGARAAEKAFAEGRGPDPYTTMNFATPTGSANQLGIAQGEEDADPLN
jgi:hypothetical protein